MQIQNGILIITSSGGAGHHLVAAQREKAEKKNLDVLNHSSRDRWVVKKDLMTDFLGSKIGNYSVKQWNDAQKAGNIRLQEKLVAKQPLADKVFFVPLFIQTLLTLLKMTPPPKKIINTQVMGCSAILKAVRFYNLIQQTRYKNWKPVEMELWMTDFVSPKAKHFLNPLKSLTKQDRNLLTVKIPNNRDQDLAYFLEYTNFPAEQVQALTDEELPVQDIYFNPELKEYSPNTNKKVTFNLEFTGDEQGQTKTETYDVLPGEKVYSLMLGSQPTAKVVHEFVDSMIEQAKQGNIQEKTHFFVFCGKDEFGKPSLFKEIVKKLADQKDLLNLSIVPVPFQKPENIAKVLARSGKKFTRSGGSTAFEHKVMKHRFGDACGKVYIVSESPLSGEALLKKNPKKQEKILLKAIPVWEGENARHLKETIDARLVNIASFKELLKKEFGELKIQKNLEGELDEIIAEFSLEDRVNFVAQQKMIEA